MFMSAALKQPQTKFNKVVSVLQDNGRLVSTSISSLCSGLGVHTVDLEFIARHSYFGHCCELASLPTILGLMS